MGARAQSSVELMVVLAIGLVALLAFFTLSQQKFLETQASLSLSQAKKTVDSLARAADEVYSEGSNSTKQVYVTIPEGANLSRSSISGRSVNLAIRSIGGYTDVNSRTSETVFGVWPNLTGSFWLTVTSYEGSVGIGPSVMQISPTALYVEMLASSEVQRNITITNFGSSALTISGALNWGESDPLVQNTSVLSFPLASGETTNATFDISATSSAIGSFTGSAYFSASNGEALSVPITVHVTSGGGAMVNISYITIGTFKNSSYTTEKLIFEGPSSENLTGDGWTPSATLALSVYNASGSSVYSASPTTNSTGGFLVSWSPAGLPGGWYSLNVTESGTGTSRSATFTVVSC
jgi:hypothetical protein